MNIALDYDHTYSADPILFDCIIHMMKASGHRVFIVTARHPELDKLEVTFPSDVEVVYCNGVAKRHVMERQSNNKIDIWIDDKPESVDNNSDAPYEALVQWRANRVEAWSKPQATLPGYVHVLEVTPPWGRVSG